MDNKTDCDSILSLKDLSVLTWSIKSKKALGQCESVLTRWLKACKHTGINSSEPDRLSDKILKYSLCLSVCICCAKKRRFCTLKTINGVGDIKSYGHLTKPAVTPAGFTELHNFLLIQTTNRNQSAFVCCLFRQGQITCRMRSKQVCVFWIKCCYCLL